MYRKTNSMQVLPAYFFIKNNYNSAKKGNNIINIF